MRWPILALWLLLACNGVSNDPGLSAELKVRDATFVPGTLPRASDGPEIVSLQVPHEQVLPGVRSERISGALEQHASSLLLALRGDTGYWIIGAGAAAIDEPNLPTFTAELNFAAGQQRGAKTLELSAVGADGRVGPRRQVPLTAAEQAEPGALVIRLRWDTNADLDLHVLSADRQEVWAGDINSYKQPPPGTPPADPMAFRQGGILDLDSNADCLIDGRREENVAWQTSPPTGRYSVSVATASLCEEDVAHWQVEVWLSGQRISEARGIALPIDTRAGSGLGAGTLACSFVVR